MPRPLETESDFVQSRVGVVNVGLSALILIGGFAHFVWFGAKVTSLQTELTKAEVVAATTPVLAIEPTLVVGPTLGNQFNAIKLHVLAKNIGRGVLELGTVSVQVSQSVLPKDLADPLTAASARFSDPEFRRTTESRVIPLSRYDLAWTAMNGTKRQYQIDASLLPNQEVQFYVDYVLEPSSQPHLMRFEVTLAAPDSEQWQSKSCDLVAPFGPLPVGFGEATLAPSYVQTVSKPIRVTGPTVPADTPIRDTLRLVPYN